MSAFGSDREDFYDEANRIGAEIADADGRPVRLGDRLRIYQSIPDDEFDFWVRRPEDHRRDGLTISREAIDGVAREIATFVMARAQLRVDEGYPPDEILIGVKLQMSPEPASPQHHDGVEALHREGTLGKVR
jgi:hypothetical protein